MREDEFDLTPC